MRISDWSSDVCSSDLRAVRGRAAPRAPVPQRLQGLVAFLLRVLARKRHHPKAALMQGRVQVPHIVPRGAEKDRKSVVWGRRGSFRVEYGGRRIMKKNMTKTIDRSQRTKC